MLTLGIDVGKHELFVSLHETDGQAQGREVAHRGPIPNTPAGLTQCCAWLEQRTALPEVHVVMEATNVYWERAAHHFHRQGCTVSVVNPAQVKFFARSVLRRGKTDKMDAEIIARFGALMHPAPWSPPLVALLDLKQLVREREEVVSCLTRDRNHLIALQDAQHTSAVALKLAQARVDLLKAQVEQLETAIHDAIREHPALSEPFNLLLSVPGFGVISAATVLAETNGFADLADGAQVSAYSGMAPSPNQSGLMRGRGSISKTGNARLRRIAYLAALGARLSHSRLRTFYEGLRERGKPPKVALVALGRKLLRIGLAVVKSGVPYQDDFQRSGPRPQDGFGPTPLPSSP